MTDHTLKQASDSQRVIVSHHAAREKKRYTKAILLLLVAVLAGVVIGVGGTLVYIKNKFHRRPPSPDALAEMIKKNIHEAVTLQAGEDDRIRDIIDEHMSEVDTMRRATFREFRTVMDRMNVQIAEVLGPERYAIWEKERERRFGKRKPPPPPHERRNKRHDRQPPAQ
ncbi:MAG: hypothetical protein LUC93_11910 [Planctomycetaceae bacterium]|nr:hypothetical protein [Planctomycetaceae bacterium]